MINQDRLAKIFQMLVGIDSESGREAELSEAVQNILKGLGAEIFVDDAGLQAGSNTGNLFARFKGNVSAPALLLNAHMDTVKPGNGVKVQFKDGIFTSDGSTILGADDKSAIAVICEVLYTLEDYNIPHGPIELALTVCEEIGLLGAKQMDCENLSAAYGYVLDAADVESIVTRAPSANRFEASIFGKAAHAGSAPEIGINAIWLAGLAISQLTWGRIDEETTCNVGEIQGGVASNIVAEKVVVCGEVRSHDEQKLSELTQRIVQTFEKVVAGAVRSEDPRLPRLEMRIFQDFHCTFIPDDHPSVTLAKRAAENLGMNMRLKTTGGGSDANVFFKKGLIAPVLGTGMNQVHTTREYIRLADMSRAAQFLVEIISLHAKGFAGKAAE